MNELSIRIQAVFDMTKKDGELWTDYFSRLNKTGRMDQKSMISVIAIMLDAGEVFNERGPQHDNKKTSK